MRRWLAYLLVLVMLAPWTLPLLAADQPGEAPPEFGTTVQGAVPDLVGRWLVVGQLSLPNGGTAAFTHLWEVTNAGGKANLEERFVTLPKPLADALQQANARNRAWEPSGDDLQILSDSWPTLPPERRSVASVETTISGKDALTDVMKGEEKIKDARFVVQMSISFNPGPQHPMKDVMLFGATEQVPDGYRGNYESVTVAAAPFPIPIQFGGTFHMHRLEAGSPRGLLQRVLDVFSGCGRRSR
jgi:hypothetical protein